ncbi:mucosal addressin cell adhesion molecule 1 isoform X2 [Crotalus tigris]|uniref:mucosal addressin cell adhesion molecule 1 isoform X2 n=1 Tax=Crotalus tigris TaxID=88082 RepID=UPI00192F5EB9|nr:mucosal addressin cell adhesion molecule 1 isoform X2 [Crotalus tigris]
MISLIFLLSLICCSCSLPTSQPAIQPRKPLVERGGTLQLICSMDCPGAEVEWEGLDTDLGNIISDQEQSILTLSSATINMEGTKVCSGECQGVSSLAKVELKVYSFPDTLQLDSQPKTLTVGRPARLLCSISHIYPHGALTLSWFQGDEPLQASREMEEEEMEEEEDQLFVYRSELELPTVAEAVAYKCKATLKIDERNFAEEKIAMAIASPKSMQELLGASETIVLTPTSGRTSQTSALELLATADWKSSLGTTTSLLQLLSTEHTSSGASVVTPTAIPTLEPLTEDHNSITGVNNLTGASDPTDQELTTKPLSTANSFSTGGTTEEPTTKPLSTTSGFSTEGTTEKTTTKPLSTTSGFSTGGTTEEPTTKPLSTTSGFSTGGTTEEPTTKALSMANGFSTGGTTEEPTTKPLSTANGFSTGGTTEEPTTKPLSTANGFSTGGTTEEPTTKPLSMANGFLTRGTTEKRKDACRPMIVPVPAEGTTGSVLRITCQTSECHRGVQIQWVETPMAQSRYRLEEAEGQSTLMVENVSLEHQGLYRCVAIASPPRVASLRIVVSAASVNTDALFTIGATGSLLGLIIIGYVSHRWRQRRQW